MECRVLRLYFFQVYKRSLSHTDHIQYKYLVLMLDSKYPSVTVLVRSGLRHILGE